MSASRRWWTWCPVVGVAALGVGCGVGAVAAWNLPDDGTDGAGMLAMSLTLLALCLVAGAAFLVAERLWRRRATPPAGWYPDPTGQARARWWTGRAWTARTTDDLSG